MHSLRHKKLTTKKAAAGGKSTQTGCIEHGDQPSKVNSKRARGDTDNSERGSAGGGIYRTVGANDVSPRSVGADRVKSRRLASVNNSADGGNSRTGGADGINHGMVVADAINTGRLTSDGRISPRSSADGRNSRTGGADGINHGMATDARISPRSSADEHNSRTGRAGGINHRMVGANGANSEKSNADGTNSRRVGANGASSEKNNADGTNVVTSQINSDTVGVNCQLNAGRRRVCVDPPKRGRGKMTRTELKMTPRTGKVELAPKGHSQFTYVDYNPKGIKYPSQVGVILKRQYPGIIKVYGDDSTVVKERPALSWNDYYWKRHRRDGMCYAQKVKQEFWSLFTVHPRHRLQAQKVLENYLVKRVTNMMYQVRLEAVKMFFDKNEEDCDDSRARTILLTEEEYLTCWVEWCNQAVWAWLSKYWNSNDFMKKRKRAKGSRGSTDDPAPNRGGSRNFSETQQFLEYTFGAEKSGTLNTCNNEIWN